jgi:hypothetical protein
MRDDRDFFDSPAMQMHESAFRQRARDRAPMPWRVAMLLAFLIVLGLGCLVAPLLKALGCF